jgi:S-adenosylmethionine hydrolase
MAGPAVTDLVRLSPSVATLNDKGITGHGIGLDDPFGSLITDIKGDDFRGLGYAFGDKVAVTIDNKKYSFPFQKTFMEVPVGDPLLYVDSRGRIAIAVNQGDFSKVFKVTPPVSVFIPHKGK